MNQLREALTAAAEHFEEYAREHRAKADHSGESASARRDSIVKTTMNEEMAKACRTALAAVATPDYVLGFMDARNAAVLAAEEWQTYYTPATAEGRGIDYAASQIAERIRAILVRDDAIIMSLAEQSRAWSIAKNIDSLAVNVPVAWNARILARAFLRLHGGQPSESPQTDSADAILPAVINDGIRQAINNGYMGWTGNTEPGKGFVDRIFRALHEHLRPPSYGEGKTIKPFDPLTARGTTGLRPGQVIEKLSEDGRPADSGLMPVWTKTNDGWRVSATETIPPSVPSNSGGSSPSSNPPDYRHVRLKDGHGIDVPVPMNPWHGIPFVLELPKGMLDDISTPPPINALKHMIAAPGTNGHTIMSLFLDVLVKDGVVTASETMDTYLYGRPGGAVAIVQRPIKDRHLHVRWPWSDAGPMNDAENKRVAGVLKAIDAPAFKECEGCKYPFACAEARSCQTEWFRLASDRHNRRPR